MMSYCDLWEYETKDFLLSCIENGFDNNISKEFFERFSITDYEMALERKSAKNVLLVHGNDNYSFSSTELSWISEKTEIMLFCNHNKNLFFVNLPSYRDTYYLDASALIKLFNMAFKGKCCYIFSTYEGIAVGSMRNFDEDIEDNFCVTKIFNETNLEDAIEFWYEFLFAEYDALPMTIISNSLQERFSFPYQADNASRFDEYDGQVDEDSKEPLIYMTYKEACYILRNIGKPDERTSFDLLEEAIIAEEKAQKNAVVIESSSEKSEDFHDEYSAEAYADAEQMLKEMLNNPK